MLQNFGHIPQFSLAEREQAALQGESGCGKTTFLHLIAGILKPDGGAIKIAGQEMSALREAARDRLRATTIGYIFQVFNLLNGSGAVTTNYQTGPTTFGVVSSLLSPRVARIGGVFSF